MTDKSARKAKSSRDPKPPVGDEQIEKPERIAKRMARAGLCSRREAESWIEQGRVVLNGKLLTTPAITVTTKDRVEVDGKLVGQKERTRLWMFNKPSGTVTTNRDPEGRRTIFDRLPEGLPRLITVGRLDINTEGLLLMTNDGGLARELELPATGWLRRYRVRVHGKVEQSRLDGLKDGIAVDGVLYGAIEAELEHVQGSNSWLSVSLREGKNREIKNVMGALDLEVSRLIRISFGPFQLGDLPSGTIREVRSRTLRDQLGGALIKRAQADFDAPILTLTPEVTRSASKAAEQGKKRTGRKPGQDKHKQGTVRAETLSRLTTKPKEWGNDKKSKSGKPKGKNWKNKAR
jgi:23S rRNA pseudouridine2605 synthase